MEFKTKAGVSIKIIDEGSSKTLIFSTSVRAIGLNKKETSKIGALLSASTGVEKPAGKSGRSKPQNDTTADPEGL
jgi:hypothetical protein